MESPSRFREITWRTISNQKFVVKAMLKAEIRVNSEIDFDESSKLFSALAKEICKLGSIKLIDAMDEKELEDYIYLRYKKLVEDEIESQKINKYNKAIDLSSVDDDNNLKKAKGIFEGLNGYMDSQNMISYCENRIKELSKKKGLLSYILKKQNGFLRRIVRVRWSYYSSFWFITRGMKGCYVYCTNKELADYLRERIKQMITNMREETVNRIRKFTEDRDWDQFHSPANLAKSIVIEAAELLECFQWSDDNYDLQHVKEELADVIVYSQNLLDKL